ncbi:hypothetical protein IQ243_10990 [Nostocales cyanobacterium LEGE 11386]|nr:hypothetical protein [Nostocales cyanobacterium LEGE 11386]
MANKGILRRPLKRLSMGNIPNLQVSTTQSSELTSLKWFMMIVLWNRQDAYPTIICLCNILALTRY